MDVGTGMYKRLRIIIASVQVGLLATLIALKLAVERGGVRFDTGALNDLFWALNYPIWAVKDTLTSSSSWLPDALGWLSIAILYVFAVLVVPGIAILWYFIVAELEERIRGRSLIRFSNPAKEMLTVALLMIFGGRATYDAYAFKYILPSTALSGVWVFTTRIIIIMWGIALIGVAIYDLVAFLKARIQIASTRRQ